MTKEQKNEDSGTKVVVTSVAPASAAGAKDVEALGAELNISAPVMRAVMQAQAWAPGKAVAEAELRRAAEGFLNGSMNGMK